jgi:hypothetical protein
LRIKGKALSLRSRMTVLVTRLTWLYFPLLITLLFAGCQRPKGQPKTVPAPAPGGRIEARLSYLEGEVSLTRDKTRLPAELNMALLPGDTVETGKDAQADVVLDDSSTIQLDPESRLGITELAKDSASGRREVKTNLMSGELKAKIAKLAAKSTFEIESPTAVAAVRGTEFIVAYKEGQPTQVSVLTGKVGVRQPGKLGSEVLVPEHNRILVKLGEKPGKLIQLASAEEEAVKAKWQKWEEQKGKAFERLVPKPKILGPEIPKLENMGEKLGSKLGKANVLGEKKQALERRKPRKGGPGLRSPKAAPKTKGALRKPGKSAKKKPRPTRRKP